MSSTCLVPWPSREEGNFVSDSISGKTFGGGRGGGTDLSRVLSNVFRSVGCSSYLYSTELVRAFRNRYVYA